MNPIAIYRVENRSVSKIEYPAHEEYYWPGEPCELRGAIAGSFGEGGQRNLLLEIFAGRRVELGRRRRHLTKEA
jgi:hypothetical protein